MTEPNATKTRAAHRYAIAALVVIGLCGGLLFGSGVSTARSSARVAPIDNNSKQAVATAYRKHVDDNVRMTAGWSGSADGCVAGSTSTEYTRATIETINWFRAMAGLSNVAEDSSDSAAAQQAALMMHAANTLSHQPGDSWACHSNAGAGAAGRSNLTLGITGPRGVVGQIEDAGAGNEALGHRRWLLYPELAAVGVGNTDRASAVEVIGNFDGDRSGNIWIAWPPAGYVPHAMVFDRWSLSFNGNATADFSDAIVTMTAGGAQVPLRVLPHASGFGDATLVWEPVADVGDVSYDTVYRVAISNVLVDGRSRSYEYDVTVFEADAASGTTNASATPTCHGRPATIVGTAGDDTVRGTPGPDVIVTLGGNDRIHGEGGGDRICAGAGNDVVSGGRGADLISGGPGRDRISGDSGSDRLQGEGGRDRIRGNAGNDVLIGGAARDVLVGSGGNDTCHVSTSGGARGTSEGATRSCERG